MGEHLASPRMLGGLGRALQQGHGDTGLHWAGLGIAPTAALVCGRPGACPQATLGQGSSSQKETCSSLCCNIHN